MPTKTQKSTAAKNMAPLENLISEIINRFKTDWQKLCLTSFLLCGLPQIAFIIILTILLMVTAIAAGNTDYSVGIIIAVILIFILLLLSLIIITLLGNLALLILIKNPRLTMGQAVKQAWGMIFSYLWISILVGLIVMVGYCLLFVPGMIFSVWFFLAPYLLFFEGKKGTQALSRSKELVQGFWWPIFGRIIIVSLILAGISMVVAWIPLLGQLAMLALIIPIYNIFIFLLYQDLKKIKS